MLVVGYVYILNRTHIQNFCTPRSDVVLKKKRLDKAGWGWEINWTATKIREKWGGAVLESSERGGMLTEKEAAKGKY
jgi:hypothetical protein